MEQIIESFPNYLQIYKKYMSGSNVKKELDDLYRPLFCNTIMPNYYEIFNGCKIIIDELNKLYLSSIDCIDKSKLIPLIDFLEFIYGNVLYETFLFEINKISKNELKQEQILIFKYIIFVEINKFLLYKKIISELDIESKFLPVMVQRSRNCELKISFSLKKMLEYSKFKKIFEECEEMISICDKDIQYSIKKVENANSFIKLGY